MSVSTVTSKVTGLQAHVTSPEKFDFSRAEAVALGIVEATMRGPGSQAFGLVGLSLWLVWWRHRLPAPYL
jgi:hypothetical protein